MKKYNRMNGCNDESSFYHKINTMYDVNKNTAIGCTILKEIQLFEEPLYLSKLNIEFANSIVSGKSISEEEINIILDSQLNFKEIEFYENSNADEIFNLQSELLVEGEKIQKVINTKKRNLQARKLKLMNFINKHGRVFCEVCGEDEVCTLDVHHDNVKVSDMEKAYVTKLSDLRIVCANCHRKIHKYNLKVDELIQKLK